MTFTVRIVPEAERQLRTADAWWQVNRTAAPNLLLDEFHEAVGLLEDTPLIGPRFPGATRPGVRRLLLRKSQRWVYYVVDQGRSLVYILAVWGASRGSPPPLV